MEYLAGIVILIGLSALAYWRGNPVVFLVTAGVSMMVGLYTPDGMRALDHNSYGVGIGAMLIMYSFLLIGLSYANLLTGFKDK